MDQHPLTGCFFFAIIYLSFVSLPTTAVMPFGRFSISGDRNLPNQLYFIMAIKLAVLQYQDQVIAEIKEIVDDGKPIGYLFTNAHRIITEKQFLAESDDDRQIQITLSPWILLSADKEVLVPRHQVVTIVEPIDSLKEMYLEKINGSESNSTSK